MTFPCDVVHKLLCWLFVSSLRPVVVEQGIFLLGLGLFPVRPFNVVQGSTSLIFLLLRMEPHLHACVATLLVLGVDEAGGGEDVLEGADHAFLQAGPANKAEPGKMT